MNNTNVSQAWNVTGPRKRPDFSAAYIASGVSETLLIPVIIIGNLIIITSILTNRTLRQDFRHLGMVSVSIADLLTGLITCPIIAEYMLISRERLSCAKFLMVSIYDMYVQRFVVTWGIVSLNADYLLTLHCVKMQLSPFMRKFVIGTFLALPWLAMLAVVLPIAYTHVGSVRLSRMCVLNMSNAAEILVACFAAVVPAILAFLQLIHMIILYRCRNSRQHVHPETNNAGSSATPWMLVCVTMATILMALPQEAVSLWLRTVRRISNLYVYIIVAFFSFIVGDARSAVLPFIWCMEADVRVAVKDLYNRLPWRSSLQRFRRDLTVDYRNF
ncbi:uncharacterized protein LOC124263502 [Haliotis rubra]|uniref:uncharacterized protein LOC124263502 n=1 Tax=Haliotis rubra TaxID=36100 RepID=UPI001EE52282|nr:uncharacterized protein LOC124263502 [Haliotis rubra]